MEICGAIIVGRLEGRDGVKLEERVLIAPEGHQTLSSFPFEDELLFMTPYLFFRLLGYSRFQNPGLQGQPEWPADKIPRRLAICR
jgi:hypothetical protein